MLINFSSSPPTSSSSCSLFKLANSKSPISEFPLKPKTHLSNSLSSSFYSSSNLSFHSKNQIFNEREPCAVSGFDLGSFESVLEAAGVLTAIIVVHESGGFVGFPDNDPESGIPVDDENLLKNRPILDRVIVISAGVVANIIFAYVIIFIQVVSVGLPVQESFPGVLVPEVRAFSAASRDGLFPGDVILSVNGVEFPKTGPNAVSELVGVIKKSPKRNVLLRVGRGEQKYEIGITPDENFDGTGKIGVQLSPNVKFSKVSPKNLSEAFRFSGKEFWGLTSNVLDSLKQTFLNFSQTASKVSGPVAIIAVGAEVARSNIDGLYQFAAVLNINLAVINLLPLPALDGGSLALILIEAARGGRKLPLELEQRIMSSGIMLVILLGLFLIVRDTLNLDFIKELL
ncbi:hypothetical protein Patl1_02009 [Pistacia atlantica]|uniref:Uncharacterized protein n=1 Tax=Pistacia atlantica TaxID=434234 RepID=A0ACC1CAH1_9ROSI|nr:hypothetical protein Patl1_02009 [Pistacia atlantica]